MLNFDLLKSNLPEKELEELNCLLDHASPKLWCGLAMTAGAVTPIFVALAATLPATLFALSLASAFAAAFFGVAAFVCALEMLISVEAQKTLLFLSKPATATTNYQEVLAKTLNVSTLAPTLTTTAYVFCQVTTFVFAGMWMPLCWIIPGYAVLIPIFGGPILAGFTGLLIPCFYLLSENEFHLRLNCEEMTRRQKI